MSLNYNSLLASTIKYYKKGFVNNIIRDFILLAALGDKDIAKNVFQMRVPEGEFAEGIKLVDGGEKIFAPLMYNRNVTINSYVGYDTLDITPTDPFSAAEFDWCSIAGSVNMDNERLDKNRGDAQKLFDLMKGMLDNLKVSMQENINDKLLGPKAAGSKDPWGLMDIVQDVPTANPASGNFGGIDVTTNSWWQNQAVNQASVTFGTDQTGAGNKNLRQLVRNCTFGSDKPNLILAGETGYDNVENSMLNQIRYISDKEKILARAGFTVLMFKGIPIVMEKRISALRTAAGLTGDGIYVLNTKYLKLWGMRHRWFEPSSVKEPVNQDTQVQHIITRLQFITDNRRTAGVLYGVV